jgi:hypothetical protein
VPLAWAHSTTLEQEFQLRNCWDEADVGLLERNEGWSSYVLCGGGPVTASQRLPSVLYFMSHPRVPNHLRD